MSDGLPIEGLRFRLLLAAVLSALVGALLLASAPADAAQQRPGGSLVQLKGTAGCLTDSSTPKPSCKSVRALKTPGPFMGSRAIAIPRSGKNLYVASSGSNAIAVFNRNPKTGKLRQPSGQAGCVAAREKNGCGEAWGVSGPNSLALSPDGRFLYASSRNTSTVTIYKRDTDTGTLRQLAGSKGCIAGGGLPGCATAIGLNGPDVITVSPDGKNIYVGSFLGNAIAIFERNQENGQLTQATDGTGCLANAAATGCTTVTGLLAPEGMAVSDDGGSVFVAAPGSNAVLAFTRNPVDGSLAQATDGYGCITTNTITGCTTGREMEGANAVEVSPDDSDVYATSLLSSSVTAFGRSLEYGGIFQLSGPLGCTVWIGANDCYPARGMRSPEGIAFSPDGLNAYIAAYGTGGIVVLNRNPMTGGTLQKRAPFGCLTLTATQGCGRGRALSGTGGIAVSPDGRFVYASGANANSITAFRRVQWGS